MENVLSAPSSPVQWTRSETDSSRRGKRAWRKTRLAVVTPLSSLLSRPSSSFFEHHQAFGAHFRAGQGAVAQALLGLPGLRLLGGRDDPFGVQRIGPRLRYDLDLHCVVCRGQGIVAPLVKREIDLADHLVLA